MEKTLFLVKSKVYVMFIITSLSFFFTFLLFNMIWPDEGFSLKENLNGYLLLGLQFSFGTFRQDLYTDLREKITSGLEKPAFFSKTFLPFNMVYWAITASLLTLIMNYMLTTKIDIKLAFVSGLIFIPMSFIWSYMEYRKL